MKMKKYAVLIAVLVFFTSCTKQSEFDLFELCKRYNSSSPETVISADSFLSDREGGYYNFVSIGESTVLLGVKTDENGGVTEVCATVEKNQFSPEDAEKIFSFLTDFFASFNYSDEEITLNAFESIGFSASSFGFKNAFCSEQVEKNRYTLVSNEFSLTVKAEKN